MTTQSLSFTGAAGAPLAARLEAPDGTPHAYALFAHCFTCGKDSTAAVKVSRGLAAHGIATLRFDFTGIGMSGGAFDETTFSSNVADLVAAADFLRSAYGPPALLVGHSLGGAAVLAAAHLIGDARAVATIGAPSEVDHVAHNFDTALPEIEATGSAEVTLGGKRFTIRRQLLEDLQSQKLEDRVGGLKRALLVMHAPTDDVVGVEHATRIFLAARHPKSFVSLDTADHYLHRPSDAEYAAGVVAAWAGRYISHVPAYSPPKD